MLAELFAPEGLIFLDPRDPAIATAAQPVHARALRESRAIAAALVARSDARWSGEAQVHVRPGAPLSYIHPSGAEGPRFRLAASGSQFAEIRSGRMHDLAELLASLERDPRFMSTSALLRPLLQDTILHTAAYVGGAAEVAYYAQLEPLGPLFGLPVPRILRRAGFRLIDHGTQRLLERLGLTPDDAKLPEEELLGRGQPAHLAANDLAARLRTPFDTAHASVTPEVLAVDPTLARELARAKHFVERSVDRLAHRYERALLHADRDRGAAVHRLKLMLHPDAPQERVYGLSWFAARHGDRAIVEHVLATADPDAPMKDLVLSQGIAVVCFPSLGGSGVIASELALGLAGRGHQVELIASARPARAEACDRLTFHEVRVPGYPLFEHAPYTLAVASKIVDVARLARIDLLHVHYAVPHAASAMLARQVLGAQAPKLVTSLHGTDVTPLGADPSYHSVTAHAVAISDGIVVPSQYLREQARTSLAVPASARVEIIPNFVDTERFSPAPPAPARDGLTLFHVSNLRPVKRAPDLVDVLALVRRRVDARLVIVGEGPARPAIEARAAELGVADQITFLGRRDDFVAELRQADAFVLPSSTESFGVAALEALSTGVPVYAYRVGGLPEMVTPEVGRLVEPYDVNALAEAILSDLAAPAGRAVRARAARAHVLARFQRKPAIDRYLELFHRLTEHA